MAQYVCGRCGAENPVGTDFCASCHAFLAWDEIEQDPTTKPAEAVRSGEPPSPLEQNVETTVVPQIRVPARPPEAEKDDPSTSSHDGPADSTEALFRAIAKQREVTVPATGEPAGLVVQVTNTSTIVDGYLVEALNAPDWLALEAGQVRLLPGTEEALLVKMRVASATLVPAQQLKLVLRIRSISQAPAQLDLPLLVTVPVVDVPVRLHAEPSLLRVRDSDTAECTLVVDNSSNRLVKLRISGSDPELAVRFRFEPQVLEVGPAASASLQVAVAAPRPEPGEEISRQLTVTAFDGTRRVDTLITFVQSTSASPMTTLALRIEPSIVRVMDADAATVQVTIDNRRGRSGVRIFLDGSDPERAVGFTFSPQVVDLSPGQVGTVQLRLNSRRPRPGKEWTRPFAVTASDGNASVEASGSLVQTSSRAATRRILIAGAVVGAVIAGTVVVGAILIGDGLNGRPPATITPSQDSGPATISLSPNRGPADTRILVSGDAFGPNEEVVISFLPIECNRATTDGDGAFTAPCPVPSEFERFAGTFNVRGEGGESHRSATATFRLIK